jgi:uncharacterized protein YbjT (DUF2867 family)
MTDDRVILVAGASGDTGREVLDVLDTAAPTVRMVTRDSETDAASVSRTVDEVTVGDLLDPADARRAVDGVDAVICCVGSTIREVFTADQLVDGPGVSNLARAAAEADVDRFVFQSAIGVGDSTDRAPLLYRLPINRPLEAKARAEETLRSLDVEHTIVRPGVLTNGPARGYPLVAEGGDTVFGLVSRADVARVLVGALDARAAADRTFEVVSPRFTWGPVSGTVDRDWVED